MAKRKDEEIKDLLTSWEGYAGSRVEEFIKKQLGGKAGYAVRSNSKEEDGNYHVRFFASEDDYNEWNTSPETSEELVLFDIPLPDTGGGSLGSTSYVLGLYRDSSGDIITQDNEVKLRIRFTSQMYNPISQDTEDTSEGGVLTVQTRLNATSAWTTRGTIAVPSIPAAETGQWTTIDITDMLSTGTQQVRLIVKGEETHLNTRYLQFSVTKTTLALRFATQWEKPVTDGVMRLQFYVQGAVSKTLHLLIDGQRKIETAVGTAIYTETPLQINVSDTDRDTVKVLTHGVHEIEAWLSVNDSDVKSQRLKCQVMVVADNEDPTPYLILNDINTALTNWAAGHILSYALYNPSGQSMPLKFVLQDYRGTEQYMTLDAGNIEPGRQYSLDNTIEIESDQAVIDAYMKFISGSSELHEMIGMQIDNSANFSPTAEAAFILNPKTRTNAEQNPMTIQNAVDGSALTSRWSGFGLVTDGWLEDSEGQKCLRIPAGRFLEIDYESFTGFIGTDNHSSLTIELDVASRNATRDTDPLLRMCSYLASDSLPLGFELRPTSAALLTEQNRAYGDQSAAFQEGVRTHIAVNILYGINGSSQNYVRLFINGIANREFLWTPDDTFVQFVGSTRTSQGIRLGSDTCDLDVYGIRVYKKALSASDIRRDYMASLPSVQDKMAFRTSNDIVGDDGRISYTKTREKYNVLVVTGEVPSYKTGNIKTTGSLLVITQGDPEHSGTMNDMEVSGQGTSSRSYWKWNFQFKFKDSSVFINELGQNMGAAFALDSTVPEATKLVAKLNWASSQQSHKMGSCNLFNDLHGRCTGGTSITNTPGFENCRVSVKQKPYLLFVRSNEQEEPVFYGLYTFGPGKGDKPTFGYDKKTFPDYLMIEGCDNGEPLTNHRIPWNDDITIGGDEDELMNYNGRKQWEIDMGNSDGLHYFRDAFNFIYLHSPHIEPYIGTLDQLQYDDQVDRQHFYWVTQASSGSAKFDLYRYDELTDQWVDAGVQKLGAGRYEKLNLATQTGLNPSSNIWDTVNAQFIDARVAKFAEKAGDYFNLKDAWFCQMFLKLIGASDNRAKNTYMYLAQADGKMKIHFAQDDLDTIFTTDNVGRMLKPYYVEEHDRDADGGTYWNGEENALYDLMELAFMTEMRSMMKSILTEMANLAKDHTPFGCIEDYYFSTQKYFPAVAYNEAARLLYEEAAEAWATGQYVASTHPLTQSLGDQLQGETQWARLRIVYMSSFAGYGPFAMNGEGSLTWRSATQTDGRSPQYTFELTPHIWLYPAVSAGSSTVYGRGKVQPQRVKAGETYILDGVQADNDTNIQLHGIHYYTKIGDFSPMSLTGSFTVAGERLTEFRAASMPKQWRPSSVIVTAPLISLFNIEGASTVAGSVNFSVQTRLEDINLKGTSISSFSVSEPTIVKSLRLPSTLTSLRLENYTALTQDNFEIEGAGRVQTLVFKNCPGLNSQMIVSSMLADEQNDIHDVEIDGVDWSGFAVANLLKLADIGANLKGRIVLAASPTFEEKRRLLEAFGNIDDPANKLYVDYTKVALTSMELTGDSYYGEPGQYKLTIITNSTRANNFKTLEWSMTTNTVGATIDKATGIINIPRIGSDVEKPSATVTVKATLIDGSSVSSTMQLWVYKRECQLGDYVFSDGSYSDLLRKDLSVVGICFYIDEEDKSRRLCVGLEDLPSYAWGLAAASWPSGIKLTDDPDYDVFEVPDLLNIGVSGLTGNAINKNTIKNISATGEDLGFKHFAPTEGAGQIGWTECDINFKSHYKGEMLPWGLINTLKMVIHSNYILNDSSVNVPIPEKSQFASEYDNTLQAIKDFVAKNGNNYSQYYFPAARLCYAYEPKVNPGENLVHNFKANSWWLPSLGELIRLRWHYNVDEDAVFQRALSAGIMKDFNPSPYTAYWCSTEASSASVWMVNVPSETFGWNTKASGYIPRPIAAF